MFIVILTYKKSLACVEQYLNEHRQFLENGYQREMFVASGPKNPRDGGIIISHINDRHELESFLQQDPFYIHEIADYEVIEFTPSKYHPDFATFING